MKIIIVTLLVLSIALVVLEAKSLIKRQSLPSQFPLPQMKPIYGNKIPGKDAEILHQQFHLIPNQTYSFKYRQTDLQSRKEEAFYKVDPKTNDKYVIGNLSGYCQYYRPDGKWQRVTYTSGANGYRANVETIADIVRDKSIYGNPLSPGY